MKYILFITFLLIMVSTVAAYDNSTLENYFTMGDGIGTTAYDTVTSALITSSGTWTSIIGVQGNALGIDVSQSLANTTLGLSSDLFGDSDMTVNLWIYQKSLQSYVGFCTPYSSYCLELNTNSSHTNRILNSRSNSYNSAWYPIVQAFAIPHYTWFMVTMVYDLSTYKAKIYVNSVWVANFTALDIPASAEYFILRADETRFDEVSIWSSEFNQTDIEILYNSGVGLNYAETLAGGIFGNESESTTDNGYYHEYCWFNINCLNYNVSAEYCDDEIWTACGLSCADTFDSYSPSQYYLVNYTFDAICTDNVTIEYNSSNFSGDYYYNYCVYDVACSVYNVSADWCEDDPRKWCNFNCADTFDAYTPAQYPLVAYDFGAECLNDSYHLVNKTQPGNNFTIIYDVCLGNILCHVYNISAQSDNDYLSGCVPTINGQDNRVNCRGLYGSNSSCIDSAPYYQDLDFAPSTANFSGYCSSVTGVCFVENATQCSGNWLQRCTKTSTIYTESDNTTRDIRKFLDYVYCWYGCTDGSCIQESGNVNNTNTIEQLTGLPVLPRLYQYMIVIIIMMVTIISLSYVGYRGGNAAIGFMMGSVMAMFWLILFTVFKWVPVWILMVLIIFAVAITVLTVFFNKGGEGA